MPLYDSYLVSYLGYFWYTTYPVNRLLRYLLLRFLRYLLAYRLLRYLLRYRLLLLLRYLLGNVH